MTFQLVETDITTMEVDVIVNAANEALQQGGGVCGAIFKAAGATALQAACDQIGHCSVGEAVMTDGYQLPAKKIIHTVGPIWEGGTKNEAERLKNCYQNSLALAAEKGYASIAFPLISSGIFGYPFQEAFEIAVSTIRTFLHHHDLTVYLVLFDKQQLRAHNNDMQSLTAYIERFYREAAYFQKEASVQVLETQIDERQDLTTFVEQAEPSFSAYLLQFIDEKGLSDVETYKKANVDRRLFSKIRNTPNYNPQKKTVLAFAIALELTIDETLDLLEKAGYTLSKSSQFDLIIRYFIEREVYDLFKINEALFSFDEVLLGS